MARFVAGEAAVGMSRVVAITSPVSLARWWVVSIALCSAVAGCTIRVGGSSDASGGTSPRNEAPAATDTCDEVDGLPTIDKRAAAEAGEAALTRAGKSLADAWADPAAFQLFEEAAYRSAGCDLMSHLMSEAGKVQQPLHADRGPDYYCGPGHGADKLFVAAVSDCLNDLCRMHDACYAQCSARTGVTCMWSEPTAACDDPFVAAMNGCEDDSNQFGSFLVRFVARGLRTLRITGFGCPADMTCPGNGPCLTDRRSEACNYCLEQLDIGGVCLARACKDDPDEATCYAANCPSVSRCYGGYDVPVPPPPLPPISEVDPTSRWSVSVLRAVIPDTKPSGELWDADAGGYASPDVVIGVRVGRPDAVQAKTAEQPDSLVPTWTNAQPLVQATALDLQTFIEFTATDLDLVFDDPIGTCTTAATANDFTGKPVAFECVGDTGGAFTVYFALQPAN